MCAEKIFILLMYNYSNALSKILKSKTNFNN